MREFLVIFLIAICILAIVMMTAAGMEKNSSKKPTIRRPNSKLEKDIRKSAAHNKWV